MVRTSSPCSGISRPPPATRSLKVIGTALARMQGERCWRTHHRRRVGPPAVLLRSDRCGELTLWLPPRTPSRCLVAERVDLVLGGVLFQEAPGGKARARRHCASRGALRSMAGRDDTTDAK